MNEHNNFLPLGEFIELKDTIMSDHFPWYFNDNVVDYEEKYFQFTFHFIKNGDVNCSEKMMNIVQPILSKIKYKKIHRIKANLLTQDINITEHGMHVDPFEGNTGIFYINTCNGYTKFENGKKIKSEENKYIEFDSRMHHTGSTCTDEKRRVVINFNYQ